MLYLTIKINAVVISINIRLVINKKTIIGHKTQVFRKTLKEQMKVLLEFVLDKTWVDRTSVFLCFIITL